MGAWGTGHFENDDALDLLGDLEEGTWKDLSEVFEQAENDYLEAPDGTQILAAAALVAAAFGAAVKDLPDEAEAWIKGKKAPPAAMKKAARAAVDRVLKPESELLEIWEEAKPKDAKAWKKGVSELLKQLG